MSYKKQFNDQLNELFKLRTKWLANDLFAKVPKSPSLVSKKIVDATINKMQLIASHALTKTWSNIEFNSCIKKDKSWKIKGTNYRNKKENFKTWFNENFDSEKNYIYVFWTTNKKKCLYVGKSTDGVNRAAGQFATIKTQSAHWIEIYTSNMMSIPKLECLAIHFFEPKHNRNRASMPKRTNNCPICDVHKNIETELKTIFKLRN